MDDGSQSNTPIIEIFGGLFALMLVLFVVIFLFFKQEIEIRAESIQGDDDYKIGWSKDAYGYFVIAHPHYLSLLETGENISKSNLCQPNSAFVSYALNIYQKKNQQIIFTLVEGGVETMAEARNCLRTLMPNKRISIGWLIADNELLKGIALNQLPIHVEAYVRGK